MIDEGDATAEAPISLGEFEADITASKHDQMVWQPVQFERFDMGERCGLRQTRNRWNAGMRAKVEEQLFSSEPPRPAIIQRHLDHSGRGEAGIAHDEFSAGCLVSLEMKGNKACNHGSLALHDLCHVHRDGPGNNAEFPGTCGDAGYAGAPYLVLAGQAVDIRAGPADPAPFNHRDLLAGLREVPCKVFSALSTADDNCIILFGTGHRDLHNQARTA